MAAVLAVVEDVSVTVADVDEAVVVVVAAVVEGGEAVVFSVDVTVVVGVSVGLVLVGDTGEEVEVVMVVVVVGVAVVVVAAVETVVEKMLVTVDAVVVARHAVTFAFGTQRHRLRKLVALAGQSRQLVSLSRRWPAASKAPKGAARLAGRRRACF